MLVSIIGLIILSAVFGLIIVSCLLAVVFFAVYIKYKHVIKGGNNRYNEVANTVSARIIHHNVYTMDYLLNNDAQECKEKGATEMNVFRFKALVSSRPDAIGMIAGLADVDIENTLVVVGMNDAGQELSTTIHCAKEGFDEKIDASVNDSGILKIKL